MLLPKDIDLFSKSTFIVVTSSSGIFLPGSPKRIAITIFPHNTGRITLSNDSPVVLDSGLNVNNGATPFTLLYQDIGLAITKPWFAIGSAASANIGVIEVLSG